MDLMTDKQVSELLGVSVAALAQWRHRGKGPPFVREGNWIRYRRSDVEAWVSARAALTGGKRALTLTPEARAKLSEAGRRNMTRWHQETSREAKAKAVADGRKRAAAERAAKGA